MMNVYQIFASIDGEVNHYHQGALSVFVRLAGCNLRCKYCDTVYAQDRFSGKKMTIEEVVKEIERFRIKKVTITGGEPLIHKKQVVSLVRALSDYAISIETNGSIDPWLGLMRKCNFIMDFKLPSSGMMDKMRRTNFLHLESWDFVKFVIADEQDFKKALGIVRTLRHQGCRARFAFSPMMGDDEWNSWFPARLVQWMKEHPVDGAILNVQLHKILGLIEPTERL